MARDERTTKLQLLVRGALGGLANPYVLLPLSYCVFLGAYFLVYGRFLQFMPLLLLAAIPIAAYRDSRRRLLRSWVPLVMILLSYEALNGIVGTLAASVGIHSLYGIDSILWGGNFTGWLQSSFNSAMLTMIATFLYMLHVPLVGVTAVATWRWRRPQFGRYVTAMAIVSFSALATFVIFPTAPPWFAGVARNLLASGNPLAGSGAVAWLNNAILSDQFAAFPSLHAAYALLFGYFMIRMDRRLAIVALPVMLGILFSTIYLGQHYLIDLIGGGAYAFASCMVSEKFQLFSAKP